MIEILPDGTLSREVGEPYSHSGKLLGRLIMPITSRLRAYYGLKGIENTDSHLDVGCGDCLFLKKSPCKKRVGLDLRYDDEVVDRLNFPDNSFANISMLAVLEHFPLKQAQRLLKDIHRVLYPGGHLIITTPRKAADSLIRLYSKDVEEQDGSNSSGHKLYYDKDILQKASNGLLELSYYREFLFGLNQLFVFKSVKRAGN
jgi:predicted SAM-dependent methyltransferase